MGVADLFQVSGSGGSSRQVIDMGDYPLHVTGPGGFTA